MQTIETKYLGPTNTKGARIKATASGGKSLTVSYDYGARNPHLDAAAALKTKLEWTGEMVGGETQTGSVFVFVTDSAERI